MRSTNDPLPRLKTRLFDWSVTSEDELKQIDKATREYVDREVAEAERMDIPDPTPKILFEDIYVRGSEPLWLRVRKGKTDALRFRQPLVTLTEGYEVCRGYGLLFTAMFNSVFSDLTSDAKGNINDSRASYYISGYVRQRRDVTAPNDNLRHGWNKFPLPNVEQKVRQYEYW
jgi:Dehydrogenase E1 component